MDFRAYVRQAADQHGEKHVELEPASEGQDLPHACSYCGAPDFENPTDNGRVTRVTCSACGGTMISHGGTWQPDLIGQPDNHPKQLADPGAAGDEGRGIPIRVEDLSSRSAAVDWCRHRHGGHCWIPRHAETNDVALYIPQDRGACPWITEQQQMINCPVSEPGPMAGMARAGVRLMDDGKTPLVPVKHVGFAGHVEAYHGHFDEMDEMDRRIDRKPIQPLDDDEQPVGHHTPLVNFLAGEHGNDNGFWAKHGKREKVDLRAQPIYATQPHVVQHHLDRYTANPHDTTQGVKDHGWDRVKDDTATHGPMFVRHEGNLFAAEGHHRTGSALRRGDTHIEGTVYDADRHGWPKEDFDMFEDPSGANHPSLRHYAAVSACAYQHQDPRHAAAHVLYNHDDGICVATEARRGGMTRESSLDDPELRPEPSGNILSREGVEGQRVTGSVAGTLASEGDPALGWLPDLDGHAGRYEAPRVLGDGVQRAAVRDRLGGGDRAHGAEGAPAASHLRAASLHRGVAPGTAHDRGAHGGARTAAEGMPPSVASVHAGEHPLEEREASMSSLRAGKGATASVTTALAGADSELKFHLLAAWRDVRAKAKRIRGEGGVSIVSNLGTELTGHVNGDTGVYETQINYVPGTHKIGFWLCGCAWASYSWGRSPAYRRYEGRMCSHALALQYEAQSRGMFGRTVDEDTKRPDWMRDKVRVRHDRETKDHDLRSAALARLDPDGVYPTGHELDLERAPIHAVAQNAYEASGDPADALKVYLAVGLPHTEARALLGDLGFVTAGHDMYGEWDGEDEDHERTSSWDDIHSNIEGLHRGVGVMLHPHDHAIVHDESRSVHERAHHLLSVMQRHKDEPGIGTHWTTEHGVAEDFSDDNVLKHHVSQSKAEHMQRGDHRWGTDPDGDPKGQPGTAVMFHAHAPERHEIDDVPNEMAHGSSSIYDYHDHGEREVPIRPGGSVSLSGISWKKKHDDFDEPDDHDDSYTHHEFGGEGRHVTAAGSKKDQADDAPTHAGVALKAADTGRVLMIQRSKKDEKDPAAGTWEWPGGGIEPGDHTSLHAAIREFEEEVGHPFPEGGHVHHVWRSGPYQGHVVVIPEEKMIDFSEGRSTTNPDDPDGDDHEQSAWWETEHAKKNPALRPECKSSPWKQIEGNAKLALFRRKVADYASHDALEDVGTDWRPKPPPKKPDTTQENPGSTGWATSGDPDGWDGAVQNAETLSLNSWGSREYKPGPSRMSLSSPEPEPTGRALQHDGELHPPSEPALPRTTADDEAQDVVGTPGEQYRDQMISHIDDAASVMPNDGRTAGMSDAVARFQASAAGKALASGAGAATTKEDTMDIAQAARDHVASRGGLSGPGISATAVKQFNALEQQELIQEGGSAARARNFGDLKIAGTHYEDIARVLSEKGDDAEILFL